MDITKEEKFIQFLCCFFQSELMLTSKNRKENQQKANNIKTVAKMPI